jgi:hypothetical protein
MKRLLCSLLLFFSVATAFSQKVYFVYLQTDNEQPFYVRINEKVYSSTASGYLILSKLKDSTYNFKVGFPQEKWPVQSFKVNMGGKDKGFQLKNFPEKGWGLIDLQTLSIQMSAEGSQDKTSQADDYKVSPFTAVLSIAANDPSLRERPRKDEPQVIQAVSKVEVRPKNDDIPAAKEEKENAPKTIAAVDPPVKKEQEPAVIKETTKAEPVSSKADSTIKRVDPPIAIKEMDPMEALPMTDTTEKKTASIQEKKEDKKEEKKIVATEENKEPVAAKKNEAVVADVRPADKKEQKEDKPAEYRASVVKKRSESSTTEGFGLTFIDEYADGKKDTIRLLIPNQPKSSRQSKQKQEAKQEVKQEKQFLDISSDSTETATVSKPVVSEEPVAKKPQLITCSAVASENDFLKLRKNMAGRNSDDGMINEAAKQFKSKCYTVEQVKNLSTLFLNDEKKLKFFKAAHGHISNPAEFPTLLSELKDEKYVAEFKTNFQ